MAEIQKQTLSYKTQEQTVQKLREEIEKMSSEKAQTEQFSSLERQISFLETNIRKMINTQDDLAQRGWGIEKLQEYEEKIDEAIQKLLDLKKQRESMIDSGTAFEISGISNLMGELDIAEKKLQQIGNELGTNFESLSSKIQNFASKNDKARNLVESFGGALENQSSEITNLNNILQSLISAETSLPIEIKKQLNVLEKQNLLYKTQEQTVQKLRGEIERLSSERIETEQFSSLTKKINMVKEDLEKAISVRDNLIKSGWSGEKIDKYNQHIDNSIKKLEELNRQQEEMVSSGTAFKENGITSLVQQLEIEEGKLNQIGNEIGLSFDVLSEKIKKFTSENEKAKNLTKSFGETLKNLPIAEVRIKDPKKLESYIERLTARLDELKAKLQRDIMTGKITPDFDDSKYRDALVEITKVEKTIEAARDKLSQIGTTARSMSVAQGMADLFSRAISNLASKLQQLGKKSINIAINGFKKFGDGIKNAISNIKKLISSIAKFIGENKKSNASMGLSFKTILKYVFGIRSLYMLVRKMKQAFKEGMQNLVQYSNEVNHSVSIMTSALGALKNAFAVAFAPIVNVVAPYITKFINMMTDAANAVGRFFAALTGKKIATQATKFYKDYAESLNGVAGAAKNADKALHTLGIDELNILNENKDEGGGGVDIEDMFTDVAVEGAISDWAKKIRDAFLNQDWEGLGKTIADMMNAGLQKLYDLINWENVGPKIEKFVDAFARTFNSLVDNLDWDLLGRVIGAGINTLVNTFNLLAEKIDFENLGRKISVGIRGMIDEINWKNLGNALGNYFMIAWRMLDGFISDMARKGNAGLSGFAELGTALGNAVNGIFEKVNFETIARVLVGGLQGVIEAIAHFVGTIKWGDIAENFNHGVKTLYDGIKWDSMREKVTLFTDNFANAFNQLVHKVNWAQIGSTIGAGIDTIARTINQLTDKMDFVGLGKSLADGFMGLVRSVNWNEVGKALTSGIRVITDVLYGFVSDLKFDEIGVALGNALNGIVQGIDLGKIGATLGKLITGMFQMAINFSKTFDWKNLGDNIANGINNLFREFDGKKVAEGCIAIISGLLDTLIETVEKTDWAEVASDIIDFMFDPRWWSLTGKLLELAWAIVKGLANGIIEKIKSITWSDVWNWILESFKNFFGIHSPSTVMEEQGGFLMQGLINGITAFVNRVIEIFTDIKEKIISAWSGLTEFFSNLWAGIQNIWSGVSSWFNENVIQPTIGFFRSLYENVTGFFRDLWTNIQNVWNQVASWFNTNVVQPLINFFRNIYEDVLSVFRNLWNGVQNIWGAVSDWFNTKVVQPVVNFFKSLYENVLSGFNSLWASIQGIWSNVSTWFNTKVIQPVIGFFKNLFTNVSSFFRDLWEGVQKIWNGAPEWFNQKIIQPIVKFFGSMGDNLKQVFNGIITFITGVFSGNWKSAWDGIVSIFKGIINIIPSIMEGVANGIINAINGIISGLNFLGGGFGVNISLIPNVSLPRFKDGGLIMSHMIAEIGEYGRKEAVLPLENRKAMSMIADSIMENSKGAAFNDNQISDELLQEQNALLREQNKLLTQIANTRPTAVLDTRDTLAGLKEQANREGWSFATP